METEMMLVSKDDLEWLLLQAKKTHFGEESNLVRSRCKPAQRRVFTDEDVRAALIAYWDGMTCHESGFPHMRRALESLNLTQPESVQAVSDRDIAEEMVKAADSGGYGLDRWLAALAVAKKHLQAQPQMKVLQYLVSGQGVFDNETDAHAAAIKSAENVGDSCVTAVIAKYARKVTVEKIV